jgi:hypothetical protein
VKDTHNKILVKVIRWGLRLHSIFHVVEFFSALYETAYLTAVIAFIATIIEILASIYLPKEHVHFKGVINEVHENCEKDENEWDEDHALDLVMNDMVSDLSPEDISKIVEDSERESEPNEDLKLAAEKFKDIPNKRILTYRKRDVSENSKTD